MTPRPKCTCRAATNNAKKLHASSCAFFVPRTRVAESNYLRNELLAAANRYGQGTMTPTHPAREARLLERLTADLVGAALALADALRAEANAPHAPHAPHAPPACVEPALSPNDPVSGARYMQLDIKARTR